MKQNFDTSALRQTAAEIQGATMPKSITPDMVGGVFSALVEAQGEVIEALGALEREVVTVKVNGYDGQGRVSAAGAKVYVDIFSIGGVPTVALPRQELTADADGVVTFEVFKGYQYAVFSKIEGLGASFQYVYLAGQNSRTVELWNMPIGVYALAYAAYALDNEDGTTTYRAVPCISDVVDDVDWEWDARGDEYQDDGYTLGVLVSTADTSFAIESSSYSDETLRWTNTRMLTHAVPTMPLIYENPADFDGDWETAWNDAVARARADFDGNLNTAKILAFCKDAPAADFCANIEGWEYRQVFLPSAGQLFLIYQNKDAIDSFLDDLGWTTIGNEWLWSSTQYNEFCAWGVNMGNGDADNDYKDNYAYVRAVSAFQFIY